MAEQSLKILGAVMRRPQPVAKAEGASVQGPQHLSVEVENPTDKPLHIWSSRRAYHYDASSHVLTLYLTEHTPPLPPGIKMISDHPRAPVEVEVKAKSRGRLDVPVPAVIRRRVPGKGLGMSFVEEPIGSIERVELHVQYARQPFEHRAKESPTEHRKRLRAHGDVLRITVTPTEEKER